MNRLVIASAALALMQGCIIVNDTEDGAGACPARADGACFAVSATCPVDAVTLTVFIQPADSAGALPPSPFECATGGGFVLVDPGTYDVRVEATNAEGDTVFGAEPVLAQQVADLTNVSLDFEFPIGNGFFWVNWTIMDAAGGSEVSCDNAGAASVGVESTSGDTGDVSRDVLPCVKGGWQSRALPLGDYEVVVSLLDGAGAPLGPGTEPIPGMLAVDSEVFELPPITFMLE